MLRRSLLCLTPCVALGLTACSSDLEVSLSAVPASGIAALDVSLTTNSPEKGPLTYRYDFDGDGTYDTDWSTAVSVERNYMEPGTYQATVEISDSSKRGLASVAISVIANQPPAASVTASPDQGRQPLTVTFDPSESTDPDESQPVEVRYDFEGDGTFDTDFGPATPTDHVYSVVGTFVAVAEVRDHRGATSLAMANPVTVLPGVDLDADANGDGLVDDTDDALEEIQAAPVLANLDDDDGDGARDASDNLFTAPLDLNDFSTLIVRRYEGLPSDATVTIGVSPTDRVRLFQVDNGAVSLLMAPTAAEATIPAASVAAGDVTVMVEGASPRTSTWDGRLTVTLTIARPDDGSSETDTVLMRAAPVLFPDNMQAAERLYVMEISDFQLGFNLPFFNALEANLPAGVDLYAVNQYQYLGDRWLQDNMQTGYQSRMSENGEVVMETYLATVRATGRDGLEPFVPEELLGIDYGYAFTGGGQTSHNYGGNLEISPPYTLDGVEHPFGRILIGGGNGGTLNGASNSDGMTNNQRQFLDAQIQGPTLELSSEWLFVGHIDEIFQFVPNPNQTNGKDFMLVVASPAILVDSLSQLESAGQGNLPIFQGRREQTTVSAMLNDTELLAYADAAQARIDSIVELMKAELALTDADIVYVPVIYEPIVQFRTDFALAYNPGIQNLTTVRNTLFVPDPEGPDQNGEDVWQRMTLDVLEPLGVQVIFVDIYESYHVQAGEAHCGTEVEHEPYATKWWEVER